MRTKLHLVCGLVVAAGLMGCNSMKSSNTARTSTEQLLISNSVDQALAKVDFRPFARRSVYLEEKYLESVDKAYIVASLRHQLLHAGSRLVSKPEEADIILEARSGGVGTDMQELFLGMPAISVPGPMPISLPEVKLLSRTSQKGMAKIGLAAYDAKTKTATGKGGVTFSQSDTNNWYVFGMGPYQNGSVRKEVAERASQPAEGSQLPDVVAFEDPQQRSIQPGRLRMATSKRTAR